MKLSTAYWLYLVGCCILAGVLDAVRLYTRSQEQRFHDELMVIVSRELARHPEWRIKTS